MTRANNGYIAPKYKVPFETGFVYGTIKFRLIDAATGQVQLGGDGNLLDQYDFGKWLDVIASAPPGAAKIYRIYCSKCINHVTPEK